MNHSGRASAAGERGGERRGGRAGEGLGGVAQVGADGGVVAGRQLPLALLLLGDQLAQPLAVRAHPGEHVRDRRLRRRIARARDLMEAEAAAAGPRREPIPEDVRVEVFRRDGGRCVACGSAELLQFDHVIPVALGGASTPANLQVLCAPCNRAKGDGLR